MMSSRDPYYENDEWERNRGYDVKDVGKTVKVEVPSTFEIDGIEYAVFVLPFAASQYYIEVSLGCAQKLVLIDGNFQIEGSPIMTIFVESWDSKKPVGQIEG